MYFIRIQPMPRRFPLNFVFPFSMRKTSISIFFSVLPALADLHLSTVGNDSVLVKWKGGAEGLRGYWLTWEGKSVHSSTQRSTLYLPPHLLSTTLTHVPHNAHVCVSPVYKSARGDGLCCTAHFGSGWLCDILNIKSTFHSLY